MTEPEHIERYLVLKDFPELPVSLGASYHGFDGFVVGEGERLAAAVEGADGPADRIVFITTDATPVAPAPDLAFMGFDASWYTDRCSHYSLVLNHLVVREGRGRLNAGLLFESRDDARALIEEWQAWEPIDPGDKEMLAEGDTLRPFAVFESTSLAMGGLS